MVRSTLRVGGLLLTFSLILGSACTSTPSDETPGGDLPLGQVDDLKADQSWVYATQCKEIPQLMPLVDPRITLSLDGLTLHLVDRASDFSRVYPIGVGAIDRKKGSRTEAESLSLFPVLATGGQSFSIATASVNPCRVWWTEPETGDKLPVFAGMPFMSFYGAYGIHGPITDYWRQDGGRLKRGYVSHGCMRMEAKDVVEVWAYIRGVAKVPVHLQKAIERRADGSAVDVPAPWIGSECSVDGDCDFVGGSCRKNRFSGRGNCTMPCDRYCDDRYGYPTTFCVPANADDPSVNVTSGMKGFCAVVASEQTNSCQRYSALAPHAGIARNGQPSVVRDVCLPGTRGWIGASCFADAECQPELTCERPAGATADAAGECSVACTKYCPDLLGYDGTFCVDGRCRRRCLPETNDAGCAPGLTCRQEERFNTPWVKASVCMAP